MTSWGRASFISYLDLIACSFGGALLLFLLIAASSASAQRQGDALVLQGRRAGPVVAGAALLLLVAGVLEGVFRQQVTDVAVRYAVALLGALALATWFTAPWRRLRRTAR